MDDLRHPDFPVRRVVLAISAAFALLAASVGVIFTAYSGARPEDRPAPVDLGPPRLETTPVENHAEWMARQRALMEGAEGRTPIVDAMRGIVARGSDAYAPLPRTPGDPE